MGRKIKKRENGQVREYRIKVWNGPSEETLRNSALESIIGKVLYFKIHRCGFYPCRCRTNIKLGVQIKEVPVKNGGRWHFTGSRIYDRSQEESHNIRLVYETDKNYGKGTVIISK